MAVKPSDYNQSSAESYAESKIVRDVLAAAAAADAVVDQKPDEFDQLLEQHDLRKLPRVCAWIVRFVRNSSRDSRKIVGPITADEARKTWWIRRVQTRVNNSPKFADDKLQLNLQSNGEGILEFRGRIQGHYPIFLPDNSLFTEKLVQHAHRRRLHGGMGLTTAEVRERFWVLKLRKLAKKSPRVAGDVSVFK